MKRVRPTENAMRWRAWRERARASRETCAAEPERARRIPVGPGIVERVRERAHARPPGKRKRAAMMMIEAPRAGESVGDRIHKMMEAESMDEMKIFN